MNRIKDNGVGVIEIADNNERDEVTTAHLEREEQHCQC